MEQTKSSLTAQVEEWRVKGDEYETERKEYVNTIEKQKESIQNMQNKVEHKDEEIESLKEKVDTLSAQKEEITTQRQELEVAIQELRDELDLKVAECEELGETVNTRTLELEQCSTMMDEMSTKLKKAEQRNIELSDLQRKLEDEVRTLTVKMEAHHKERREEMEKEETAKQEREEAFAAAMQCNLTKIKALERVKQEAVDKDQEHQQQIERQNGELERLRADLKDKTARFEKEVETIKKERECDLEALRDRFKETHVANAKYQKVKILNVTIQNELDSMTAERELEREQLTQQLEREKQRTNRMVQEMEELKSKHTAETEENLELQFVEIRKLKVKAENVQKQLAKMTQERDRLKQSVIPVAKTSKVAASQCNDDTKKEVVADKVDNKKYNDLLECYKQQKNEFMDLQLKHSTLQERNERLENEQRKFRSPRSASSLSTFEHSDDDTATHETHEVMGDDLDGMFRENVDENNRKHRCWNLYDWYHDETVMNVLDDILSGDAEDDDIEEMFSSLKRRHEYIHEAVS